MSSPRSEQVFHLTGAVAYAGVATLDDERLAFEPADAALAHGAYPWSVELDTVTAAELVGTEGILGVHADEVRYLMGEGARAMHAALSAALHARDARATIPWAPPETHHERARRWRVCLVRGGRAQAGAIAVGASRMTFQACGNVAAAALAGMDEVDVRLADIEHAELQGDRLLLRAAGAEHTFVPTDAGRSLEELCRQLRATWAPPPPSRDDDEENRREAFRAEVDDSVRITLPGGAPCRLIDVSVSGCAIETSGPLPSPEVDLRFDFEGEAFVVRGEPVYATHYPPTTIWRHGIRLTRQSVETNRQVREMVMELQRRGIRRSRAPLDA